MSLDNLERDLYSRSGIKKRKKSEKKKETHKRPDLDKKFEELDLGEIKDEKEIALPSFNWKKWLSLTVTVVFVISVLVGSFYLWQSINSLGVRVNLQVKDEVVRVGVPFKVDVSIANETGRVINNARLSVDLPDNLILLDNDSQRIVNRDVGDIGVGVVVKESFDLVAISGAQTLSDVEATVFYESGSISSTYEAYGRDSIVLEDPVVAVDIEAPKKIFSGERFDVNISYKNDFDIEAKDVEIQFLHPDSFEIISVLPEDNSEGTVWNFDSINREDEGELTVVGSVVGPAGSFFDLVVRVSATLNGERYVISEKSASLSIEPSPLSLSIHLNDKDNYITRPGDVLNYVLVYENNTSIGLKDIIITSRLNGQMFDYSSLKSDGFFNFSKKEIVWDASSKLSLSLINPGQSGTVSFSIKVSDNYPINRLNDKNFNLLVESQIESPTVPENVASSVTTSIADITTKVAGDIEVDAKVLFRDADSGFVNSGSLPLKVDTPTQFTVRLSLKNFSTDISEAVIKTRLAPSVKWTGNVKSTIASVPSFNERTGEVEWNIGDVSATRGVLNSPVEAIFQVEVVPSLTNVGNNVLILQETEARAVDNFTALELVDIHKSVDSKLSDDSTVNFEEGKVVE